MNLQTFLFLHSTTNAVNINREARINVNYDSIDASTGRITGLTVTVSTLADWSLPVSTVNELDLENVLLTATSIKFVLDNETYTLPILNRTRYTSISGNTNNDYYYFQVTPTEFSITDSITNNSTNIIDITFLPFIQNEKYQYSDNNPLISNALENRTSTYIQQSDRVNSGVKPSNLSEILDRTATPAQTQDSNYTTTGWSNARYVGSITDAEEYKGIPPAITAKLFTGELNPSSSVDNLICSRSISDRILTELLFTADQEVPTFEGFVNTRYQTEVAVPISSSIIPYEFNSTAPQSSLEIGSIIQVESNLNELMRVEKIEPELTRIQVTRNYLGTPGSALAPAKKIYTVKPLRIFKIDNTSAKIVNSTNTKVWVKESKEILVTDNYGMVYTSSSVCTV